MANPRRIEIGSTEYKRLEAVAKMLEAVSPNNATYEVCDTYFDYGQDWVWTTIIRYGYRECQVLNPVEWEEILLAESVIDLAMVANSIRKGDYFGDVMKGE